MKIITGSSITTLAQSLSDILQAPIVETDISHFKNGEKRIQIKENVAGQDIILMQSFSQPVDEAIVEFLLLADAIERMGARSIHAVIPWMGYSLQDKVFRPGEPIAAKMVANLVSSVNINRVYLLDLHNSSIPGFFSIPAAHISAMELFAADAKTRFAGQDLIVASPDFGGLKRAGQFAELLGLDLVNIDKQRDLRTGQITSVDLHGSVTNKTVLLFDDVIVSGGTVKETSELLMQQGATATHFYATHGLFVGDAAEQLTQSPITSVLVTNSIQHKEAVPKVITLDCAPLLAKAIQQWL